MRDLLPGGYVFTHLVFWIVAGLIVVGTNTVPILLTIGMAILLMESLRKG